MAASEVVVRCAEVIEYSAVTGTDESTADTVATLTGAGFILLLANKLSHDCWLTRDGEKFAFLPANTPMVFDFSANRDRCLHGGTVLGIFHLGTAPTSGRLGVTVYG